MATNPIGKDTKTIGINMNAKMADDLESRAESMHLSTSKSCKIILTMDVERMAGPVAHVIRELHRGFLQTDTFCNVSNF